MKKFLSVLVLAFSFILLAHSAQAFEVKVDNSINLNPEEIADGNVYASCGDMKIDGTVNGDLIAMCKSIVINGTVNGDLIAFSQDITINGEVKGSVRIAGTNLTINGTVGHNVNTFGTEINLTPKSSVGWDVLVAGVNGQFNGTIGGNLHGSVSTASIAGKIGKNINLTVDDVKEGGLLITKDAIVAGGITYTANSEIRVESPSSVAGTVLRQAPPKSTATPMSVLANIFYKLAALFLIGLILISLKKKTFYDIASLLEVKNWQAPLIGLGALILTPIVILFFVLTIIGIPLALILLASYLSLIILSLIFAAFFTGDWLLKNFYKKPISPFISLLLGLTILVLLSTLPYIGGSFIFVFMVYGLGGILLTIKKNIYA